MVPFQSAVVALSGDISDAALLEYAAKLEQLGVLPNPRFAYVTSPGAAVPNLEQQLRSRLSLTFPGRGDSLPLEIMEGNVLDQLLALTAKQPVDLLLVGCRLDRNGRPRLAQRLAMSAPCSIWMAPQGTPPQLSRILAPIDYSTHSAAALSIASALAKEANGKCLALHVYFDESAFRFPEQAEERKRQQMANLEKFVAQIPGVPAEEVGKLVEESVNVAPAILRVAADQGCDLIVMDTRGRTAAAAILLGSETAETMNTSRLPVLVIKKQGAHMGLLQAILSPETWHQSSTHTN